MVELIIVLFEIQKLSVTMADQILLFKESKIMQTCTNLKNIFEKF